MIDTGRIIVVGAGLGGLYAALSLAPRPVLLISPDPIGQGASSVWAQGGIAAAMSAADSPEAHAADTVKAGAGTVDASVATSVTAEAQAHILDLTAIGTPFDRDAAGSGKSVCNGQCAALWPPLMASATDQAAAPWGVVTRDDGSKQWSYKGKPLYFYQADQKAGDRTGDGVNNIWKLARP